MKLFGKIKIFEKIENEASDCFRKISHKGKENMAAKKIFRHRGCSVLFTNESFVSNIQGVPILSVHISSGDRRPIGEH